MAIKLSANYSKKIGLPQFSSHSFSASVEVELTDINQVEEELHRLYEQLQHSVDQEIQHVGFSPPDTSKGHGSHNGNGRNYQPNSNGRQYTRNNNGTTQPKPAFDHWNCTDGQKGFIQRIVNENSLDKNDVEEMSQQLFGLGIKQLNKLQASQIIEELLAKTGQPQGRSRWQRTTNQQAA